MGIFSFLRKKKAAPDYIIAHPENYDTELKEVIVLTRSSATAAKVHDDEYWSATVRCLGYIDATTGKLVETLTYLRWDLTESDAKHSAKMHNLKGESIYRLLVRSSVAFTAHWGAEIPAGRSLFVVKVLERNCKDERLAKILEEYKKPRTVTLSDSTVLDFCHDPNWYSGIIDWLGGECNVMLHADDEDFANADEAVKIMEQLLADKEQWDKKAREFAAKEMTSLANDWQDQSGEEETRPITRADFARRIGCPDISVYPDGSIEFVYDDDEMFWGHIIVVNGSMDEGFTDANIEG